MLKERKRKLRKIAKHYVDSRVSLKDAKNRTVEEEDEILSTTDESYIDYKYIKYCMQKIKEFNKEEFKPESYLEAVSFLQNVTNLENLSDLGKYGFDSCPELGLLQHATTLKDITARTNVLQNLKQLLISEIIVLSEQKHNFIDETDGNDFTTALVQYLTDFKTQFLEPFQPMDLLSESYQENFDLDWAEFTRPRRRFADEVSRQHAAIYSKLSEERKNFTSKETKEFPKWSQMIKDILTTSEIRVEKRDERKILIVKMPVIVLSKCISQIIRHFENDSKITDIHFIATYVFYINASLHKNIWHGKNILVLSEKIECLTEGLRWDVSGIIGKDFGNTVAHSAKKVGFPGAIGENGGPGEGGGNIAFIYKEFVNAKNLTIFTNGGPGGNGQKGGDGKQGNDGENGKYISLHVLKSKFESPVKVVGNNADAIVKTVIRLRELSSRIHEENFVGFTANGEKNSTGAFPKRSFYIKGDLNNGGFFEFSFSQWTIGRGAYLLLKGAKGTAGQSGGDGGLGGYGGEGGYPGKVECLNFKGEVMQHNIPKVVGSSGSLGVDGQNGANGPDGKDGKDGFDTGYSHSYNWNIKFFEKDKYNVVSTSKKEGSVYCEYLKTERCIERCSSEKPQRQVSRNLSAERSSRISAQKQTAIDLENAFKQINSLNLTTNQTSQTKDANGNKWTQIKERARHILQSNKKNQETREIARITYQIPCQQINDISSNSVGLNRPDLELQFVDSTKFHRKFSGRMGQTLFYEHYIITYVTGEFPLTLSDCLNIPDIKEWENVAEHRVKPYLYACLVNLQSHCKSGSLTEEDISMLSVHNIPAETDYDEQDHDEKLHILLSRYLSILNQNRFKLAKCDVQLIAELFNKRIKFYGILQGLQLNHISEEAVDSSQDDSTSFFLQEISQGVFRRIDSNRNWEDAEKNISSLLKAYNEPQIRNLERYADIKQYFVYKLADRIHYQPSEIETMVSTWPKDIFMMFWDVNFPKYKHMNWVALFNIVIEITNCVLKGNPIYPVISMMIILSPNLWSQEICLFLLERADAKQTEMLATMRCILEKVSHKILDKIYPVCQAEFRNLGYNTFAEMSTFFKSLAEFEQIDSHDDCNLLDGVASRNQVLQQLEKILALKRLKELDKRISQENSESCFSEILYYYEGIMQKYGKLNATKLLQILLVATPEKFDIKIPNFLQKISSGLCRINEQNLGRLQVSNTLSSFLAEIATREEETKERDWKTILEIILMDEETDETTKEEIKRLKSTKEVVLHFERKSNSFLRNTDNLNQENHKYKNWALLNQDNWCSAFREEVKKDLTAELLVEGLKRIDSVIQQYFSHKFRCTQDLAVAVAALSKERLLAEINTGEGKSYIVLALAILKGLSGMQTDIITSSKILAQRDAIDFLKIYAEFGLSVGHVTMENSTERTRQYNKTVVYGEASQFQRDYLQDRFYNTNVRGSRPFESIIIDEVDSMFLDKGNNVLYMSHTPSNLDELESIFVYIWVKMIEMLNSEDEFEPLQLFQDVSDALFPSISQDTITEYLSKLPEEISDGQINTASVWKRLMAEKIIDREGIFKSFNFDNIKPSSNKMVNLSIKYIISKHAKVKNNSIRCPTHLKEFVRLHLFTWIKNAYKAFELEEGAEYVLHMDYYNSQADKYPLIVILDLDTGTDLKNSQWGDGLHQFLQLKHGCKLSSLTMKSVFTSNISFFLKYKSIFGLSGTLGTAQDKIFLKKIYKVNFLNIPTFLEKRFIEEDPIFCSDTEKWKETLLSDASQKLESRSVLVLCETIQTAEDIAKYFEKKKIICKSGINLYRRDFEPLSIANRTNGLDIGELIIATNLAGRGTDIKLNDNLKKSGGLHVIFSYLPNNRVKLQGFGRAARCGDPGSGRLIFCSDLENEEPDYTAIEHISYQNKIEMCRVNQISSYYTNVICLEEKAFAEFEDVCRQVTQCLSEASARFLEKLMSKKDEIKDDSAIPPQVDLKVIAEIIKQSMMDEWVFWLDKYSKSLKELSPQLYFCDNLNMERRLNKVKDSFSHLLEKYTRFTKEYKAESLTSSIKSLVGIQYSFIERKSIELIKTPALLVKLAKYYICTSQFEKAEEQLDKVIKDPDNSSITTVAARYYKLYCSLQKEIKDVDKQESYDLISSFEDLIVFQNYLSHRILKCPSLSDQTSSILHNTGGFQKQKESAMELLIVFRKSVEKLFGVPHISPNDFADILQGGYISNKLFFDELIRLNILVTNDAYVDLQGTPEKSKDDSIKSNTHSSSRKAAGVADFLDEISSISISHQTFAFIDNENQYDQSLIGFKSGFKNELKPWIEENIKCKSNFALSTANEQVLHFKGTILRGDKECFDSHPEYLYFKRLGKAHVETFYIVDKPEFEKLKLIARLKQSHFVSLHYVNQTLSQQIYAECIEHKIIDDCGILIEINFPSIINENFNFASAELKASICNVLENVFAWQIEKQIIFNHLETSTNDNYLDKIVFLNLSRQNKNGNDYDKNVKISTEEFKNVTTSRNYLSNVFPNMTLCSEDLHLLYPKATKSFTEIVYRLAKQLNWVDKEGRIIFDESNQENVSLNGDDKHYHFAMLEVKSYIQLRRLYTNEHFKMLLTERLTEFGPNLLGDKNVTTILTVLTADTLPSCSSLSILKNEYLRLDSFGLHSVITLKERSSKVLLGCAVGVGLLKIGVSIGLMYYMQGRTVHTSFSLAKEGIYDMFSSFKKYDEGKLNWSDLLNDIRSQVVNYAQGFDTISSENVIPEGVQLVVNHIFESGWLDSICKLTEDFSGSMVGSLTNSTDQNLNQIILSNVNYTNTLQNLILEYDSGEAKSIIDDAFEISGEVFALDEIQNYTNQVKSGAHGVLNFLMENVPQIKENKIFNFDFKNIMPTVTSGVFQTAETTVFLNFIQTRIDEFLSKTETIINEKLNNTQDLDGMISRPMCLSNEELDESIRDLQSQTHFFIKNRISMILKTQIQQPILEKGKEVILQRTTDLVKSAVGSSTETDNSNKLEKSNTVEKSNKRQRRIKRKHARKKMQKAERTIEGNSKAHFIL